MPSKAKSKPNSSTISSQALPPPFLRKKAQILSDLASPQDEYTDKSPKGSVDIQIHDLIDEINAYDGFVTTSSCAGRVALFLEGPKPSRRRKDVALKVGEERKFWDVFEPLSSTRGGEDCGDGTSRDEDAFDANEEDEEGQRRSEEQPPSTSSPAKQPASRAPTVSKVSPGGKGGGRWLFTSHDPIPLPPRSSDGSDKQQLSADPCKSLLGMCTPPWTPRNSANPLANSLGLSLVHSPRLIRLQFSPLILHVLCATLHHARVLLSAAINAGFRESGIHSLKVIELKDPMESEGVMVAVRTAGVGFESVVGVWDAVVCGAATEGESGRQEVGNGEITENGREAEDDKEERKRRGEDEIGSRYEEQECVIREELRCLVDESYVRLCLGVVNERFEVNEQRRERFRRELRRVMKAEAGPEWEDGEKRRNRKMREGLKRSEETRRRTDIDGGEREDVDINLESLNVS